MTKRNALSRRDLVRGRFFKNKDAPSEAASTKPNYPMPANPVAMTTSDPTPPPGSEEQPSQLLSQLYSGFIDPQTLEQLFTDIEHCAEFIEAIPRTTARQMVQANAINLNQAKKMLLDGTVKAVQLRYRYDNAQWWDTLMNLPQGVKIVRVRHDF